MGVIWNFGYTKLWLTTSLLCLVVLTSLYTGVAGSCPEGLPHTTTMKAYSNRCFQFVGEEMFWDEASQYCSSHGGKLIKIGDPATNRFIKNALDGIRSWNNKGVWIGLHDRREDGKFEWVTELSWYHEPLTWTNWGSGHPTWVLAHHRDCVRMLRSDDWKWHETFCHALKFHYRFICEYAMPKTTQRPTRQPGQGLAFLGSRSTTDRSTLGRILTMPATMPPRLNITVEAKTTTTDYSLLILKGHVKPVAQNLRGEEVRPQTVAGAGVIGGVVAFFIGLSVGLIILAIFVVRRRKRKQMEDFVVSFGAVSPDQRGHRGTNLVASLEESGLIKSCAVKEKEDNELNSKACNLYSNPKQDVPLPVVPGRGVCNCRGACSCVRGAATLDQLCHQKRSTLSNAYVLHDPTYQNNSDKLGKECSATEAEHVYSSPKASGGGSGNAYLLMGGGDTAHSDHYDVPQPSHVYTDIPTSEYSQIPTNHPVSEDAYINDSQENMYECLDDVREKLHREKSEA